MWLKCFNELTDHELFKKKCTAHLHFLPRRDIESESEVTFDQLGVSLSCQSRRLRPFLYHQITNQNQPDQKHLNKHQCDQSLDLPQLSLFNFLFYFDGITTLPVFSCITSSLNTKLLYCIIMCFHVSLLHETQNFLQEIFLFHWYETF